MSSPQPEGVAGAAALVPLFRELLDAKRIRSPHQKGTLAEWSFAEAWGRLLAGEPIRQVALHSAAHAVAAARLGIMDVEWLRSSAGLTQEQAGQVLRRGFDAVAQPLEPGLTAELREVLTGQIAPVSAVPSFAWDLQAQPRAGATRPGHGRIILEPAESHAAHCWLVAINGVLAAPLFGAPLEEPFLVGLAHHLHNAYMPDSGDAGDHLLGEFFPRLQAKFRAQALEQVPAPLRTAVEAALELVYRADSPAAQAFQTADVLDRVLEMEWHARTAAFTLSVALEEMDIVHPGPVQAFQLEVMRATHLLP